MIKIKNISKSYGGIQILDDISMEIRSGGTTAIWGPSGCGKTTLFNILSGLEKNYKGSIENLPGKISYCFQEDRLLMHESVAGNIRFVRKTHDEELLAELLSIFRLDELKSRKVRHLSGGQKQRTAIARALYFDGDLLLLDEPFRSLDLELKLKILSDIIRFQKKHELTIILVTHDAQEAYLLADTIFTLNEKPCSIRERHEIRTDKSLRTPFDIRISEIFRDYYL
ncbi:MAG: ABC transporter ATP-binding protein [Spirochaetes bacterium]|nr:ABC transporter ATP-binding protein [Spirochaetota bacterium]